MHSLRLAILPLLLALPARAQDVTPPGNITDLFASSGTAGGVLELSWSAPEDDSNGGDIIGGWYRVDYSSDTDHVFAPGTYEVEYNTTTSPGRFERHTATGLLGNTTYFGRVYSADDVPNFSGLSNGATALTLALPGLTPGHSANAVNSVIWSWSKNPDNRTGTMYYASDEQNGSGWDPNFESWGSGGKQPNELYHLNLKTRNSAGIESPAVSTEAYTAIQTPAGISFPMIGMSSITASASGSFSNLSSGISGILLTNPGVDSSGWIQTLGYTSISLSSNSVYSFTVQARNGDGDATAAVPVDGITRLYPPTDADLNLIAVSSTQMTVTVGVPPGFGLLNTGCEFDDTEGPAAYGSGQQISSYSFKGVGLSPNSRYGYRVRYYNAGGLPTDYSGPAQRYTRAAVPTAQAYSGAGEDTLQADWLANNNPDGTWYVLEISSNGYSTMAASSQTRNTFAHISGLSPDDTYQGRVKALNEDGVSSSWTDLGAIVLAQPPVSLGHSADAFDSISWTWTGGPGNPGGTEYYAEDDTGNTGWVPDLAAWLKAGKSVNSEYRLRVKARNADGVESVTVSTVGYTRIETPTLTDLTMVGISSITANALGTLTNLTTGQAGVKFVIEWKGIDSGWVQQDSYTFVSLTSNTIYSLLSSARNGDGDVTGNTASTLTATKLHAPSFDHMSLTANTSTQISLALSIPRNPNAIDTGCEFENTEGPSGYGSGKQKSSYTFVNHELTPNTRYGYRARYFNSYNYPTPYGPIEYIYTRGAQPTAQAYTGAGEDTLRANWLANNNPQGTDYVVEVTTGDYSTLSVSSQTKNTYALFTGLTPDTTYAARVRVVNGDGVPTPDTDLGQIDLVRPPGSLGHAVNTLDGVSWTWALGSGNPGGTLYYAEDGSGNSGWQPDPTGWVTSGRSVNTKYTLRVKARNADGVETPAITTTAYTAIEPPTGLGFDMLGFTSITARGSGSYSNLSAGVSGLLFSNQSNSTTSDWIQQETWTSTALSSNTYYAFNVRARNGDGDDTATQTAGITTLLYTPSVDDITLTPDSSTQISLAVAPPPNFFLPQTGCQFDNTEGPSGYGSGKQTSSYTFVNVSLNPNRRYGFRVRYHNLENVPTEFSDIKYVYTRSAEPTPQAYTSPGPGELQANWLANNNAAGTDYVVEITTDGYLTLAASSQTKNTYALFTGLATDTTFEAQVKAVNGDGLDSVFADLGQFGPVRPPTAPTHVSNASGTVSWQWSLGAGNPAGTEYYAYDALGNTGWQPDLSSWDTGGKQDNTKYTLTVKARSADGIQTVEVSTTAYTSILDPTEVGFDMVGVSSVTLRAVGSFRNLSQTRSGILLSNVSEGTDSTWIKSLTWTTVSLASNTLYQFSVTARNGDADQTAAVPGAKVTRLYAPTLADLILTADSSTQMTLALAPPPASAYGLTGCAFVNTEGPSGYDSGKQTSSYTFVNHELTPNTRYGY
ncbi:fibronectin type III domain-containing protein, partial [Elusimicrobiota bacterium]